jgi:hypothetical protein
MVCTTSESALKFKCPSVLGMPNNLRAAGALNAVSRKYAMFKAAAAAGVQDGAIQDDERS